MPTQIERLQVYLEQHRNINPLEAWQHLGIYRLSSVIHDLRKRGLKIDTNITDVTNKFGEKCHVAKYVLQ